MPRFEHFHSKKKKTQFKTHLKFKFILIFQVPPVKTALKLAMFGQNNALMHLCAMALKIVYVLKSSYPRNQTIKYTDPTAGNSQTRKSTNLKKMKTELNCGVPKSDFSYETDETPADLQMSNSSQFHLSNLLLLTLAEKAIKDKQLMPLWLVRNGAK